MATYVYKCTNELCSEYEKPFNKVHSMKQDKLKTCDVCKKDKLELIPQKTGFIIKGIGVYKNNTY